MILKKLFRIRYCKKCFYKNSYYDIKKQNKNLNEKLQTELKFNNYIEKLINNRERILFIRKENLFVVTVIEKYNLYGQIDELTFKGYSYDTLNNNLERPQTLYIKAYLDNEYKYINEFYIEDFLCDPNRGYGSIMMSVFLEYINQFQADYVTGFLSFVDTQDEEHYSRLKHFYKKFGFVIDSKDHIKLELNKN